MQKKLVYTMPISQYTVRIINICLIQFSGTNLNANLINLVVIIVYYIGIANGDINMSKSKHISQFVFCTNICLNLLTIPHFISHFHSFFFSKISQKQFK